MFFLATGVFAPDSYKGSRPAGRLPFPDLIYWISKTPVLHRHEYSWCLRSVDVYWVQYCERLARRSWHSRNRCDIALRRSSAVKQPVQCSTVQCSGLVSRGQWTAADHRPRWRHRRSSHDVFYLLHWLVVSEDVAA